MILVFSQNNMGSVNLREPTIHTQYANVSYFNPIQYKNMLEDLNMLNNEFATGTICVT